MKMSEIKTVKAFCESLHSTPDWREVVDSARLSDFEVDGVRFISFDEIDNIQCEELESDLYVLGCFNASFLSSILDIDQDVIEAMQKAEAFEAVGKLIVSTGKLSEVQKEYSDLDGYGHHFNHYDFSEDEITIDGIDYHVFDNHQ